MCLTRVDPLLDSLRQDTRWVPFLRKIRLADDQLTWLTKDFGPTEG
jgi:hypothetical protein